MNQNLRALTNFHQITPNLGTAGMPTRHQFSEIAAAGYQVVINLALVNSPDALQDEAELVTNLGMEYVHIPVIWEDPRTTDVALFFENMQRHQDKKIFVHCVLNMRVSAFVYLYRVLRLGTPTLEAYWDVLSIWQPDEVWTPFMHQVLIEFSRQNTIS
jgi:protein tyrosine phosphatase (PTP) superfamily phosphohydrolase (DUF442 family)